MASINFVIFKADWLLALLKMLVTLFASSIAMLKLVMVEPSNSAALPISTPCEMVRLATSATDARISLTLVPLCASIFMAVAASLAVIGNVAPISRAFLMSMSSCSSVAPEMTLTFVISASKPPPIDNADFITVVTTFAVL